MVNCSRSARPKTSIIRRRLPLSRALSDMLILFRVSSSVRRSKPKSACFPVQPSVPTGPVKVMIRHEAVNAKAGGILATVEEREFLGGEILYRLRFLRDRPSIWNSDSPCIGR